MNLSAVITPTRTFNLLYIILDSVFILILVLVLILKHKKDTLYFSLLEAYFTF